MGKRTKRGGLKGHYKLWKLCAREDWTCYLCHQYVPLNMEPNTPMSATRDHVIPKSKLNGNNPPGNLRLAHRWCNWKKGNKRAQAPEAYAEGLIDAQLEYEVKQERGALV